MRQDPFWKSAKVLLEYKLQLAIALVGLIISTGCFGAGLASLVFVFGILLGQQTPLSDLIRQHLVHADNPAWLNDLATHLAAHVPTDPFRAFVAVLGVIALLSLIGSAGRYLHEYIAITVSNRAAMNWRKRMFRRLIRAPLSTLSGQGSADYMTRVLVDASILNNGYQIVTGRAIQDLAKGLMALCVAFFFNWQLTLIALVAAPLLGILLRKFGKKIRKATTRALDQRTRLLAAMREVMAGISVVKVHNAEGYERRRFNQINRDLFYQEIKARTAKALSSPVIDTLAQYAVMAVAIVAAWRIFYQQVPPKDFMTVLTALAAAGASLRPLTNVFSQLKEAEAAAGRVLQVMDTPVEPGALEQAQRRAELPRHSRSIAFERITYVYPGGREKPAVDAVSLDVQFGQTIAIVGGNGAGKTTLLNTLPRLIEPTSGRVRIDGTDIASADLRSLRRQIAMVTQQTILFQGTIADNIAYGRRHESRERIIAAARAAYADDFVRELPRGYDTLLGEDGSGLSGGQRQRLCIARAVLRNPSILILDEATSQIDAESEAKINRALADLRHGRTTFIIAHRLSTVVDADLIVVMDAGHIIDQGTHTALLQRCPAYQVLIQTQLLTATA